MADHQCFSVESSRVTISSVYTYIHVHIFTYMYPNISIYILGGRGDGGSSVFQCRVVARDYFECGPLACDYPRIWYGYVDVAN